MLINRTEADERAFLDATIARVRRAAEQLDGRIREARSEIIEAKKYMWENRDQLDPAERAANVVDISISIDRGESAVTKRHRLRKLESSPYFRPCRFYCGRPERALRLLYRRLFFRRRNRAEE
ncbi:hypothetical protein [Cohnella sp.]|uniref:hypothetical protein n=1 Tax=Cohnella sp. TaxID=1883426 RepID=UPI003563EB47